MGFKASELQWARQHLAKPFDQRSEQDNARLRDISKRLRESLVSESPDSVTVSTMMAIAEDFGR